LQAHAGTREHTCSRSALSLSTIVRSMPLELRVEKMRKDVSSSRAFISTMWQLRAKGAASNLIVQQQ